MTRASLPIKDQKLLEEALTHRSYLNESAISGSHNERLEFLGDAVLELAVSEFLYQKYPSKKEGDLTAYRAALVRTTSLAGISSHLKLGELLHLSKGEELSGGRTNPSLLANTFEAVVGALYLDQGYDAVVKFLQKYLFPHITEIIQKGLFKDYKSTLQEMVQSQGSASPEYQVIKEEGPDHNKRFTVQVLVDQKPLATGTGKSKQSAQQKAASHALEILGTS